MKLPIRAVLTLGLFCANVSNASSIIFNNGMDRIEGGPLASIWQHVADDFLIETGGIISDVHWRGYYFPNSPIPSEDDFIIRIYNDAGGAPTPPGTHIYEATAGAANRMDTLLQLTGNPDFDVYEYGAFIAPFVADPGVPYWIDIFNNIDGQWAWTADLDGGNSVATPAFVTAWEPIGTEQAFQLTTVPEPVTLALLGLGLAGLGFAKRRQKPND